MEQYLTWDIEEFTQKLNEQLAPLGLRVTEEDVKLCFYNRKTLDWRDLRKIYEKLYNEKLTSDRKEAERIERERAKEERRETRKQERKVETRQWQIDNPDPRRRHNRTHYLRRMKKTRGLSEEEEQELLMLLDER